MSKHIYISRNHPVVKKTPTKMILELTLPRQSRTMPQLKIQDIDIIQWAERTETCVVKEIIRSDTIDTSDMKTLSGRWEFRIEKKVLTSPPKKRTIKKSRTTKKESK